MEESTDSIPTPQQRDRQFWWRAPLDRLYDRLTLQDAPRLLLSIGRFEVSKMRSIDFEGWDELIARRDRTAPTERHFFCEMSASGIRLETARLSPWNTYGEVAALREYLKPNQPRSLILVSTDLHLRRVAGTFARVFRETPVEVNYCPVPAGCSSVRKEEWWTRPADRGYVFRESVKLAAYHAILKLPAGITQRIMQLKKRPG